MEKLDCCFIEVSAKTVEEAIREGISKLNAADISEIEYEVLDEGQKGFLGIGGKSAKIKVKLLENPVKTAEAFINEVSAAMGFDVLVTAELTDEKHLYINIAGAHMGVFIGKRGQTLDALQYLANLTVNKNSSSYVSVILDAEGYRKRRKETLETLAYSLAKRVKQTKTNIVLEPMNPTERRIIHSALQNDRFVTTFSEGEGSTRNIVIAYKNDKDTSKPNRSYNQKRV